MADGTVTCPNCGSVYELTKQKIPVRDKDSIDCEVCGEKTSTPGMRRKYGQPN